MNILDPISAIMTKNPLTVSVDETLANVARLFANHKIHHLPVVTKDGELIGMISKSDFLFFKRGFSSSENDKVLEEIRMNNYTASDIMTIKLAKMEPTDKINVALEVFKENLFHAIPIVENNKLKGIVTTYDIINRLALDNEAIAEY